jgi:hypothetical protein
MEIAQAELSTSTTSVPCTGAFCPPHYLMKVLLVILFAIVVGGWVYGLFQPTTMESSLDMSIGP